MNEGTKAEIYPMLGSLGDRHGSLSIECTTRFAHKCTLKVYPRIVHYLKAHNIGIDISKTVCGLKTRLEQVEALLMHLQKSDPKIVCGFRFEFVFETAASIVVDCYNAMRDVAVNHQGVPNGVVIKKWIEPNEYIEHLLNVVAEVKSEGLNLGMTNSAPTLLQEELMARMLNAAGYCYTKWINLTRERRRPPVLQQMVDGEDNEDIV